MSSLKQLADEFRCVLHVQRALRFTVCGLFWLSEALIQVFGPWQGPAQVASFNSVLCTEA